MTATAPGLKDYVDDVNKGLLKKDLLKTVAPICYKYKLETAVNEGVAAPYELLVIDLHLDDVIANISAGTKNNPFLTTEKKAYNFKNLKFEQCKRLPGHIREFAIRNASASRAKLLYELPSKITKTTQLISLLQNKRIVLFGNSLTALLEITPHVVSSRNSDTVNKQIRTDFNAGTVNIIGSFKKLKQGANLHEADTAVIHSYYSKSKDYIQRAGRVLRQSDGKYSYIVVFRTLETQEMLWFDRMVEDIDPKRVKFFTDVESCANYVLTP
jgi:superfamily II DNA or RNA helicase